MKLKILSFLGTILSLWGSSFLYSQQDIGSRNISLLYQSDYEFDQGLPESLSLYNDVWGFQDSLGTEYAIIGTRVNNLIYRLGETDIHLVAEVAGGDTSVWRDFKFYNGYVYGIADVVNDGLFVIDVRNIHRDSIMVHRYRPTFMDSPVIDSLRSGHNLYIDERGYLYISGSNHLRNGILVYDLNTDPVQPQYTTRISDIYSHDVFVQNGLLATADIFDGHLRLYDVTDLSDVLLLGQVRTSSRFTHNVWLDTEGKYAFTTDERPLAWIDAYDISDPTDITLLDRYRPFPGGANRAIPHNVHYHNGYLVTSYYTEGLIVIDANNPHAMTEVARYDTSPDFAPSGFNGCWGAYPFLPSGRVLASDIQNGLFVFDVEYQRATYVEGQIIDNQTGIPIAGVEVTFLDDKGNLIHAETSDQSGTYIAGVGADSLIRVRVNYAGYDLYEQKVAVQDSTSIRLDIALEPQSTSSLPITDDQTIGKVLRYNICSEYLELRSAQELKLGKLESIDIYSSSGIYLSHLSDVKFRRIDISDYPIGGYFIVSKWSSGQKLSEQFIKSR